MIMFSEIWDAHEGLYSVKHETFPDLYDHHLGRFVGTDCTLIEFGILRGGSLQIWRKFLGSKARIIGVDCEPHDDWKKLNGDAETVVGFQEDAKLLADLPAADIVIDDAGHFPDPQIATFDALWPRLKPGGVYVVEDLMPRNAPLVEHIMRLCYLRYPVHIHREILIAIKVLEPIGKTKTGHA